jgi:hypothetical protein
MYYLVNVVHNNTAEHLTRSDFERFKKCCISNAVDDSEEGGNVRSECGEGEGSECEDGDSTND